MIAAGNITLINVKYILHYEDCTAEKQVNVYHLSRKKKLASREKRTIINE